MAAFVRQAPTGNVARRAWFFYETLTGQTLELHDAPAVTAINALDPQEYFTATPVLSKRHRVRDNLLGSAAYCPVIRRTAALDAFLRQRLANTAAQTVDRTSA